MPYVSSSKKKGPNLGHNKKVILLENMVHCIHLKTNYW